MFEASFFLISQITQQLEGICLQVIGLVLQKPIIGMAGVCARAFSETKHTHTRSALYPIASVPEGEEEEELRFL